MNVDRREWLTPREAAAVLGVAVTTLRSYVRRGLLTARKVRGSRLVRVHIGDLEALLQPLGDREPAQIDPAARR